MHFEGAVAIRSSPEELWRLITDIPEMARCVPGLQEFEILKPLEEYGMSVAVELGALRQTFRLRLALSSIEAPRHARLRIQGRSGQTYVGATSSVFLSEAGDEEGSSEMHWSFGFSVHGLAATIGERIIQGAVEKVSQRFIDAVKARAEGVDSSAHSPTTSTGSGRRENRSLPAP